MAADRFEASSQRGQALVAHRTEVFERARESGATNVRVFGSVAHGTDLPGSDIDLLVDLAPTTSLFTLGRLERDLAELLGDHVDVVPARSLRPHVAERVLREAVPL